MNSDDADPSSGMADVSWDRWVDRQLSAADAAGRRRHVLTLEGTGPVFSMPNGEEVISFASNDYLGLTQHPAVIAAAREALLKWGAGSGASRLVVGARRVHSELEEALADWRGAEAALLFSTGYAANLGVLSTFAPGARVVSDEMNHASIIDGTRLSKAEVCIYRHCDLEHAAKFVREAPGRVVLVSDTVFSMDGDAAPVTELSELCARTGALLVLDDAHVVFELPELDPDAARVRVGTLSKSLGSLGGYVAASARVVDLLVNRARSFIFTTAPTPADTAAALAALAVVQSTEGRELRRRLRVHVDSLRPHHPSAVLPIVIGDERDALAASEALLERGLLVPAIRPPSVPEGTSRLRVAISAAHSDDQIKALSIALDECDLSG